MEHRRADRRYQRRVAVAFVHEGRPHSAESRNISLGGMFLDTDVALPYGARLELEFYLPTQPDPVKVVALVRWSSSDGGDESGARGAGLRFEGLRARDVWALNNFFERSEEAPGE
ncbi:MAG: hypothetical protein EXR72_16490 [Myxococcales bacterium]|nr:hypothetical protein [Myxococcales bacterium]